MMEKQADEVKALVQLRCRYLPIEDRIRVTGELEDQSHESFWLTRRMVCQMIPHIGQHIEKQAGKNLPNLITDVAASLNRAQAKRPPQEPPEREREPEDAPARTWIVVKVNLAPSEAGLRLVFVGENQERASIAMRAPALCRWIAVLHAQSRHARWDEQTWPDWVEQLQSAQTAGAGTLLH